MCPICGQNDCVRSVSSLIAEGISSETQFGVGYIAGGIAPMIMGGQSRTMLAQRLMPPAPPGHLSAAGVMVPFWLFNVAAAVVIAFMWRGGEAFNSPVSGLFTFAASLLPAILLGLVVFLPVWLLLHWHPIRKRRWEQSAAYLGGAYYCGRDDVIFDAAENYDSPESFIPRVFATAR